MKVSTAFRLPSPPPWQDAAASRRLRLPRLREGDHPCTDCLAMCCFTLVVESDRIEGDADLERLGRRLDYDGMALWVESDGTYVLGILTPCRFLGRTACECTVHGTARQPDICRSYEATSCWYRMRAARGGRGRLRLDPALWPDFRRRVSWDAPAGRLRGLPSRSEVQAQARPLTVPATLAFSIPEDAIENADGLGDLLYFYSNFERVRLCRAPDGWYLLYDTRRDAGREPCELETGGARVDFAQPGPCVFPTSAELHRLARGLGRDLFRIGPEDLALRLGQT